MRLKINQKTNPYFMKSFATFLFASRVHHIVFLCCSVYVLTAQTSNELFSKGETAYELGNFKLAVQYLSEALNKKPDWEKAHFIRGKAYLELGDYTSALDDFNSAYQINPNDAEYLYYKGRSEWRLNRMKIAIADLEEALIYNPSHFETYQTLGDLYLELKMYGKAKGYFDKAVSINPTFVPKGLKSKTASQNKEDYKEAMQEFNLEIQANPKNGEAYFNRGLHKEMVFDFEGALEDFGKAVQVDTSLKISWYYSGLIYFQQQKYKEAYDELYRYTRRFPDDAEAKKAMEEIRQNLRKK